MLRSCVFLNRRHTQEDDDIDGDEEDRTALE